MSRNKNRLVNNSPNVQQAAEPPGLQFVTPTELVDLPSRGLPYASDHPLHNSETVEIRYMTAKEEDILTSPSFLSKGIALDRLIGSVLVDKTIDSHTLLSCDRNAILIAARITGFGPQYETSFMCPLCSAQGDETFDLADHEIHRASNEELLKSGVRFLDGQYHIHLKQLDIDVVIRSLTYAEDDVISKAAMRKNDLGLGETITTDTLKAIIVSVDGVTDKRIINHVVEQMPVLDSRQIRKAHGMITPSLSLEAEVTCNECKKESKLEVPFSTGFFWPEL